MVVFSRKVMSRGFSTTLGKFNLQEQYKRFGNTSDKLGI